MQGGVQLCETLTVVGSRNLNLQQAAREGSCQQTKIKLQDQDEGQDQDDAWTETQNPKRCQNQGQCQKHGQDLDQGPPVERVDVE